MAIRFELIIRYVNNQLENWTAVYWNDRRIALIEGDEQKARQWIKEIYGEIRT